MDKSDHWSFETEADSFRRLDKAVGDGGVEYKTGDRVRLRPLARGDIFDIALDGKEATIVAIEQDYENRIHLAVTIDDDPGADLGVQGKIGHRFFFRVEEVEPLIPAPAP